MTIPDPMPHDLRVTVYDAIRDALSDVAPAPYEILQAISEGVQRGTEAFLRDNPLVLQGGE